MMHSVYSVNYVSLVDLQSQLFYLANYRSLLPQTNLQTLRQPKPT